MGRPPSEPQPAASAAETASTSARALAKAVGAREAFREQIDEKTVDLKAGTNSVTFTETVTGEGVARYQVRLIGAAYPPFMLFTIVATGNHFLFDAAAGGVVMVVGWLAGRALLAEVPARAPLAPVAATC